MHQNSKIYPNKDKKENLDRSSYYISIGGHFIEKKEDKLVYLSNFTIKIMVNIVRTQRKITLISFKYLSEMKPQNLKFRLPIILQNSMNLDMENPSLGIFHDPPERDAVPQTPREREIFARGQAELQLEGFNKYASHKSVSQNLLNTSIIQSHIGTLVYILSNDSDNEGFEIAAITLICASLILQILIFFMLTWLVYRRQDYTSTFTTAVGVNVLVTCASGIALVVNIAITAVALEIRPVSLEK